MAVTPEGKVKKMVNKVLDEFVENLAAPQLKRYWPVPSGYGTSDLDCIVCYRGRYIAIETKAPGEKPTPRQELCIAHTQNAEGVVFVIDSELGCDVLRTFLRYLQNADNSKP